MLVRLHFLKGQAHFYMREKWTWSNDEITFNFNIKCSIVWSKYSFWLCILLRSLLSKVLWLTWAETTLESKLAKRKHGHKTCTNWHIHDHCLCRFELCHICIVTLLNVFVGALQNWILLERCDLFQFFNAAKSSFWIFFTSAKVHPWWVDLFAPSRPLWSRNISSHLFANNSGSLWNC